MNDDQHDKELALCAAAPEGPWEHYEPDGTVLSEDAVECRPHSGHDAAAFMAHFDPVRVRELLEDNARLDAWVTDLLCGMYVNCVYCGHRYGPSEETPVSMADVLKEHIEQCPEHPMSAMKAELEELRASLRRKEGAAAEDERPCPPTPLRVPPQI